MHSDSMILRNMNQYIEAEGLKRKRLAKRMNMSESNFSDYLNGKRMNGIYDFSAGNLLSERGKEGIAQLTKICDLLEIYNRGDSHA